jgi:type IV pilus assembly protein PilF
MKTIAKRLTRGSSRLSCALLVCALSLGCVTTTSDSDPKPALQRAHSQRDLGLDYLSQGRAAMAIRELQHAHELSPDDAEILLWLGEGYRRKGRLEDARVHMEHALRLSPDSHLVLLNLSGLYIQLEQYDLAIQQSDALMADATFAAPWEALNNRGWAYFQNGELDAAEESFREALDYHPRYWPSRLNLGILASKRGEKLEAVDHFNQVLDRDPDSFAAAEVNFRMGEVYATWGHRERAIGYFRAAVDISPNSRWGEESQGYLDLLK